MEGGTLEQAVKHFMFNEKQIAYVAREVGVVPSIPSCFAPTVLTVITCSVCKAWRTCTLRI